MCLSPPMMVDVILYATVFMSNIDTGHTFTCMYLYNHGYLANHMYLKWCLRHRI